MQGIAFILGHREEQLSVFINCSFQNISNESNSFSGLASCVLIESQGASGKSDSIWVSQIPHFKLSIQDLTFRNVDLELNGNERCCHIFTHSFSSLGDLPNRELPFVVSGNLALPLHTVWSVWNTRFLGLISAVVGNRDCNWKKLGKQMAEKEERFL